MPGTPNYTLRPAIRPPPNKQPDDPLAQLRAAQTVNMSAELFEKLFLSQQLAARGGVGAFSQRRMSKGTGWSEDDGRSIEETERRRKAVGNPTPMCVVVF